MSYLFFYLEIEYKLSYQYLKGESKVIRKAKTSDNRQIAELCYLIWRDMELDITKEITKDRIIEAIELSIVNVRYRSFYEHIWVYEKDGVVAGCVIAYPGKEEMDYEQQWLKLPLEEDIIMLGTPLPEKESYDDEIYIETVVTSPKYRGQGIATQLLKYVIFTHAHEKWGLNCDYDNNKARHLYHKLGFKEDATIHLYGHQYFHMTLNNK